MNYICSIICMQYRDKIIELENKKKLDIEENKNEKNKLYKNDSIEELLLTLYL
jgi:hypothetical protein